MCKREEKQDDNSLSVAFGQGRQISSNRHRSHLAALQVLEHVFGQLFDLVQLRFHADYARFKSLISIFKKWLVCYITFCTSFAWIDTKWNGKSARLSNWQSDTWTCRISHGGYPCQWERFQLATKKNVEKDLYLQRPSSLLQGIARSAVHVQPMNRLLQTSQGNTESATFGNQQLKKNIKTVPLVFSSSVVVLAGRDPGDCGQPTHLPRVDEVVKIAAPHHETVLNVSPFFGHRRITLLDRLSAGHVGALFHFFHLVL